LNAESYFLIPSTEKYLYRKKITEYIEGNNLIRKNLLIVKELPNKQLDITSIIPQKYWIDVSKLPKPSKNIATKPINNHIKKVRGEITVPVYRYDNVAKNWKYESSYKVNKTDSKVLYCVRVLTDYKPFKFYH